MGWTVTTRDIVREILDAEEANPDADSWDIADKIAGKYGRSSLDLTDEYIAESDAREAARRRRETRVKVRTVDYSRMRIVDLTHLESRRTRIKGSANWVTAPGRDKYGATEYVIVREPRNRYDKNAVAVYGKQRKVGYISAAKAAALAPLLDQLDGDGFMVGGTPPVGNSIVMWVDLPSIPELRRYTEKR